MRIRKRSNRDVVLEVASHLFLTKGYQLTSMDDIVATSKVSKTNIYYHFKSKEDILLHIIEKVIEHYSGRVQSILSLYHVDVRARIEFVLRMLTYDAYQQDCQAGCPFLTLFAQTSNETPAVQERMRLFFQSLQTACENLLQEGVRTGQLHAQLPVAETASLILSLCEGGMFLSRVHREDAYLQKVFVSLEWLLRTH
ncbi:TetR/AcrR family transcriptional regulator [Paenibacillus sp. ACRRX]|uniref:TetR/AcrR family transcriptional regulator n=1 Tax=unclassified Paenibacillus TaxID=185978 RepID=UPI001EF4F4BD|nr:MULTISPECIES: TetR/AcrR family transcriptional regulator [unclassified Paenibacillus]MCG7408696.1 TetR/AcrR family transcriptional regulator [Paenibacillus sp. ACRRX]MDK8183463.1 TetR/AcrR family transcriptional regulator [Paenibacillus sp. UMB4589-SE434]